MLIWRIVWLPYVTHYISELLQLSIAGGITLGDDAAVGPNSVVVKDVPPMAVVSGIPAIIIAMKGSSGYVAFPTSPVPPPAV
jgi:serine acetyltransferase